MFVTSFSFNCFAHNYLIFYIFKHKKTSKIKNTVFSVNNTIFLGFRSSHLGTLYCFVTSISPYSAYLTFSQCCTGETFMNLCIYYLSAKCFNKITIFLVLYSSYKVEMIFFPSAHSVGYHYVGLSKALIISLIRLFFIELAVCAKFLCIHTPQRLAG